jgi:hypothetical protein
VEELDALIQEAGRRAPGDRSAVDPVRLLEPELIVRESSRSLDTTNGSDGKAAARIGS